MSSGTRHRIISLQVKILEQIANHEQSKQKGQLLSLDELPQFLREHIKDLENTSYYKEKGYVWFYLVTAGTELDGYFKVNQDGKTFEEMLQKVSKKEYNNLPFNEKARFWRGNQPLRVGLNRGPGGGRLGVTGSYSPQLGAPVVVVKQNLAQASSQAGS